MKTPLLLHCGRILRPKLDAGFKQGTTGHVDLWSRFGRAPTIQDISRIKVLSIEDLVQSNLKDHSVSMLQSISGDTRHARMHQNSCRQQPEILP